MLLKEALLAGLAVFICYGGNWLLGQCMCERPIVVGLVAGILMGDIPTGVIIGASLEAIFMGAVNIGGAISAEPVTATVLAVVFTTVVNMEQSASIALAVPVGVVCAFISIFVGNVVLNAFAPALDKAAAAGSEKGLAMLHYGMWVLKYVIYAAIAFAAVLLGAEPVSQLVHMIPANVMAGLNACGSLLPAVGMALLMKMLWSKELAAFFFAGFVCVSYLGLPMIAVAAIGVIVAVVSALRDKELFDLSKRRGAESTVGVAANSEEEDFFS
jgi:PTS system mannose-specific IIC component